MSNPNDTDPKDPLGPRLSLKAIAEQAVRTTRQASPPPVVPGTAESLPPLAPRVPAPPHVARFDINQKRDQARPSLLLPATLIALVSAALAGGVVWWFAQAATPTAPPQPATVATPPTATTAAAATAASAAATGTGTTVGNLATPETAAVVSPPVPATAVAALPMATSPAGARGTARPQPAKSASVNSADLAKAIANADPAAGPVLAGSGPPVVPPGAQAAQEAEPSDLTPSSGAVQAAVGSVLGNARNCVAGDREASRARVIFESSGAVSAVAVSGPAAGTPAEACIKAALSKARVAPFQKPNYSVDTTIRP